MIIIDKHYLHEKLKYFMGDEVWFLYNNKAIAGNIVGVDVKVRERPRGHYTMVEYHVSTSSLTSIIKHDYEVFDCKSDLINSL